MEKRNFIKAFGNLKLQDAPIVRDTISRRCGWSPQAFGQKRDGERQLSEFSPKKINEVAVVESTFRAFGLDAWTGESILITSTS